MLDCWGWYHQTVPDSTDEKRIVHKSILSHLNFENYKNKVKKLLFKQLAKKKCCIQIANLASSCFCSAGLNGEDKGTMFSFERKLCESRNFAPS